jgi:hypothetical protein
MILLAPVWGPVFIVVGARQVLHERRGRALPARMAPAREDAADVGQYALLLTAGLTLVFMAVFLGWLAFALPPGGFARIPVALVAASLASSVLFFPLVFVTAVLSMGAAQKSAQRRAPRQN